MPKVEMQDVAGGGRICFRGDSREPSVIFKQGFFSRRPDAKIGYNQPSPAPMFIHKEHERIYEGEGFKTVLGKTLDQAAPTPLQAYQTALQGGGAPKGQSIALVPRTPDIDTPSAVCVSPRFAMAVLFPPKAGPTDNVAEFTWVYAVYVRQLFNTHAQQVCDGLRAIENELAVRARIAQYSAATPYGGAPLFREYVESVALWPLYAQELATKSIDARDVICAVKVRRAWKGDDWTYGCDYILSKKSLKFNRRCKSNVDKAVIKAVQNFFKSESVSGSTPSRASGFHKDDENTRTSIAIQKFITVMSDKIRDHVPVTADDSEVSDSEWLD
jgi:hypothetical protein